jgi:hypothetical protein
MSLGKTQERLVAGVIRHGLCERVTGGKVDAQVTELFKQLRSVGGEKFAEVDAMRISAPQQEHSNEIEPSSTQSDIERAGDLSVRIVPV